MKHSDFYYIIDSSARNRRLQATQYLVDALNLQGSFSMDMSAVRGDFTFTNVTAPVSSRLYSANGCFRDPRWPWYLQEPPWWTLLFLVPLYAIFSALAAYQPFRSRELPVMVLVSCCSYAANRVSPFAYLDMTGLIALRGCTSSSHRVQISQVRLEPSSLGMSRVVLREEV